jgi:hypothetical protein
LAAALVGAIALPNTVMGQSITLNRCPANGTGGPSPLCTTQIGVPVVAPSASQSATNDPSVDNDQSNRVSQDASNRNSAGAVDVNAQSQHSTQIGGDQSNRQSNDQDVSAHASNLAIGGTTVAVGPSAKIDFALTQSSDTSARGDATVDSSTGQAGGNSNASGAVSANGGERRQR